LAKQTVPDLKSLCRIAGLKPLSTKSALLDQFKQQGPQEDLRLESALRAMEVMCATVQRAVQREENLARREEEIARREKELREESRQAQASLRETSLRELEQRLLTIFDYVQQLLSRLDPQSATFRSVTGAMEREVDEGDAGRSSGRAKARRDELEEIAEQVV
jgi:DNA integrity scanning protein DisA with diadenylate cyclase activity